MSLKISVVKGDLTQQDVDAIVNPANSYGLMGGGVALAIKQKGGIEIQEEALARAPLEMGTALLTTAGKLRCKAVIHSPTMQRPSQLTTPEHIASATHAALVCAEEHGLESIAFPGMGTGGGGVSYKKAAEIMVRTLKNHSSKHLKDVVLVAWNDALYNAFQNTL